MEFRHLRYFVAAAEEVHFSRAAKRLRISGQALGLQIKELEEELGIELFERLPRGLSLTPAGTALLADTRRVFDELRALIERTQDVGRGKAGVLRLGHVATAVQHGMALNDMIPAFCARYPNVEVRSTELSTAEQYAALSEGRIDVGIVYGLPGASRAVKSEFLGEYLLDGALSPAAHPLARHAQLRCAHLGVLPLLMAPAITQPEAHDHVLCELRARGLEMRSDPERQITDAALRISLISAGVGWMPTTAATAEMLLAGRQGVVFRKWADAPISFPCYVVCQIHDHRPIVANCLAFCRELRETIITSSGQAKQKRSNVAT